MYLSDLFTKFFKSIILAIILFSLNQCGLYKKTDAREIPTNAKERAKKQVLKVTLSFYYSLKHSTNLNDIENVKDYSSITKYLKELVQNSNSHTLEHLIINVSKALEKKFKIKDVKVSINKTAVAKRYGAESVSVSNW